MDQTLPETARGGWTAKRIGALAARALPLAALLALVLAAYQPALRAYFVWDDDAYLTENGTLTMPNGLVRIWMVPRATPQYYPLVFTTFWLQRRLWGLDPMGYHLVNILLHALGAALLYVFLRRLVPRGAWLAAAVFAVHPLNVESVAWITERKNVLSGVFFFGALLAYARFAGWWEGGPAGPGERPAGGRRYYLAALFLFLMALFSKTVAASLPVVILIVAWWRRGRVARSDLRPLVPFFALGLILGLNTAWLEVSHVGASGGEWNLPIAHRLIVAGRALAFYAWKTVWPSGLTFIYPRWEINGYWWEYLYPAGVLAVLGLLWAARGRLGRGPLAALLYYGATLFPALGFLHVYPMRFSFVANHFQYLSGPGLIVLAVAVAARALEGVKAKAGTLTARRALKALTTALTLSILLALVVTSHHEARSFRDPETLWRDNLAINPDSWIALNNLGMILYARRDLDEAEACFLKALKVKPGDAGFYNNLGLASQDSEQAEAYLLEALKISPYEASFYNNLGMVMAAKGETGKAEALYKSALAIEPGLAEGHNNLGIILAQRGKVEEAMAEYREAMRLKPGYAEAHYNLAYDLARQGETQEALGEYREALRLKPDYPDAHNNLGSLLGRMGDYEQAAAHFSEALRLKPDFKEARENLEVALRLMAGAEAAPGTGIDTPSQKW